MVKASELVAQLLTENPNLRDDDRELYLAYLEKHRGAAHLLAQQGWAGLCHLFRDEATLSYESIRRARQKLQADGRFLGTRAEERGRMQHEVRGIFRRDD